LALAALCLHASSTFALALRVAPLRTAVDRPFDVRDIRLDLRVDLPGRAVEGTATLQVRSLRPIRSIGLDAENFQVKRVTLASGGPERPVVYSHDGKRLVIYLDPGWPGGRDGTLRIDYRVHQSATKPTGSGLNFYGPTAADPDIPLQVWSQGETNHNRRWFPCVDEPGQRQSTEVVATVPAGFEAVSNGKLLWRRDNPDRTVTFDWRQEKTHPTYLVTLVVGRFDVVREDWEGIPVLYYVPPGRAKEVPAAFGRTREMLSFFSDRFGVRYPWDKYAQVVVYSGGGMENTSATTFGEWVLEDARDNTTIDNGDGVIAHEMAHHWWGDLVTCREWAHTWLNEGFASYAATLWTEHCEGPDGLALTVESYTMDIGRGETWPLVSRRRFRPSTWREQADPYSRGEQLLHMLRRRLGDEAFFRCLNRYATDCAFQSVETVDFRRACERETGRSLERFFYDWADRAVGLRLEVRTGYLPDQRKARLVVRQTQQGEAYHFPFQVVFHCAGSSSPTVLDLEVTEKETTALAVLAGPPTVIEVDPALSVLAPLTEIKSEELWRAQLREPAGAVSRTRAARHLGKSKLDSDRQLLADALVREKSYRVQQDIAQALGSSGGDISRDALVAGLRDKDARVRLACLTGLSHFGKDEKVATALKAVLSRRDPSSAVEGNALHYYAQQERPDTVALVARRLADRSTGDRLAGSALGALGATSDPSALDLLLEWCRADRPASVRGPALSSLVGILGRVPSTEPQQSQAIRVLTDALRGNLSLMVARSLREANPVAEALLPTLDAVSQYGEDERTRKNAREAAERIRAKALARLQEEAQQLRRTNAALREQMKKVEAPSTKH
jgi:aminopeptidase N